MKLVSLSSFAAALIGLAIAGNAHAQPANPPANPPMPITRILAIGTINPGADMAKVRAILPTEVKETVRLYLDGKIDQWFSLANQNGVAFLLNVTDPKDAATMLENLPLGQARLMHFDLTPLAPLGPLRQLPGKGSSTP